MDGIGKNLWAIVEGHIPPGRTGDPCQPSSLGKGCMFYTGDHAARVRVTTLHAAPDLPPPVRSPSARIPHSRCVSMISRIPGRWPRISLRCSRRMFPLTSSIYTQLDAGQADPIGSIGIR